MHVKSYYEEKIMRINVINYDIKIFLSEYVSQISRLEEYLLWGKEHMLQSPLPKQTQGLRRGQ